MRTVLVPTRCAAGELVSKQISFAWTHRTGPYFKEREMEINLNYTQADRHRTQKQTTFFLDERPRIKSARKWNVFASLFVMSFAAIFCTHTNFGLSWTPVSRVINNTSEWLPRTKQMNPVHWDPSACVYCAILALGKFSSCKSIFFIDLLTFRPLRLHNISTE